MKWLLKNFGLATLGFCILASAGTLETQLLDLTKAQKEIVVAQKKMMAEIAKENGYRQEAALLMPVPK